jgi:alanine racemase
MRTRPVWVEISREKLIANYIELVATARRHLAAQGARAGDDAGAEANAAPAILAVVKADAYGHGMTECARLLHGAGAQWLGVTSVEEAVRARALCPAAQLLVMSGIWDGEADAVVEHRLAPVVWENFHLDLLEAEARRQGLPPRSVGVHLELDTGMSRQGVGLRGGALKEILMRFHAGSALRLDGLATHFSAPEVLDSDETERQRALFDSALRVVAAAGLRPPWIHAGNSATLLRGEQLAPLSAAAARIGARLMLRPGLALYGYAPRFSGNAPRFSGNAQTLADEGFPLPKLSPVLTWKTRIASLRQIETGESAGYNATFRAYRSTRLALLPMGYADGLSRSLSNRGSVLVQGRRAPIAGRISMDQTILDITDLGEVKIGDEAVVLGEQGGESITAWEMADLAGTIPYEVLCNIAARVARVPVD